MTASARNAIPYKWTRTWELARRHGGSFLRHNTARKLANLCRIYLERWTGRTVLRAHPCEIIIEPTNICHLKCPLCPTGQNRASRPAGKMEFTTFQRIIDELAPWLYKVRLYNWGEPFMHKDIYRMIAYAGQNNIGTEISSHMNVFHPAQAGTLVESGLELLIVSLDGADSASYVQYRQGGDFAKVCANIRAIVDAKRDSGRRYPIVEIQYLVMRHNETSIPAMASLAKDLGVDRLRLGPLTINVRNESDWQWLPRTEDLSRYSYHARRDKIYSRRRRCEWLWRSTVINWDCTVSPCCVYEGSKSEMGSLQGRTFQDIWNNECYVQARRVFARKRREDPTPKGICAICGGTPIAVDEHQHGLY